MRWVSQQETPTETTTKNMKHPCFDKLPFSKQITDHKQKTKASGSVTLYNVYNYRQWLPMIVLQHLNEEIMNHKSLEITSATNRILLVSEGSEFCSKLTSQTTELFVCMNKTAPCRPWMISAPFQDFLSLCTDLCYRFLIGNYIAGNSTCSLPGRLAIYTSYQCGPIPHTHNKVYRNFNIHRRIHPGTAETHFMVPSVSQTLWLKLVW
jgi:hypothetical protein